jgi:uncharacterized protein YbaA (DUF1428 family)
MEMLMFADGFVIPISKANVAAYTKIAKAARKVWMKHGALEYRECVYEQIDEHGMINFLKLAKVKEDETVVFSWIVYKSKAHRAQVMKKVMSDPFMDKMMKSGVEMPFDMKRMVFSGFKVIVK